jgi:hypothetical protein
MTRPLPPEAAGALLEAQGLPSTPEGADAYARFISLQLGNAAKEFAKLAFEAEPSGYVAALRANTR